MTPFRLVLIANPGTKRCEAYRRSAADFGDTHAAPVELEVVPWAAVVPADGGLDGLPAFARPALVRLESPGKDAAVSRLLLAAGARDDVAEPPRDWSAVELPKGILYRPGLWYRGFRRVLEGLKRSFDARPHLTPTACPLAVATMFDKTRTLAVLRAAGVPVPDWQPLSAREDGPTWIPLFRFLRNAGWPRAYVKLNTGSSATGIVVCEHRDGAPRGLTTLVPNGTDFFNTRSLSAAPSADLEPCLKFLATEGALVQRGVPHAQFDGQNADLRVVCVRGTPVASIFRLSPHPITNLHLGGRRGDFARCRAAVPTRYWLDALDACSVAAGCFDSTIAGVDVVFEPGFRRHHVLEVNAFGDFFPGWTDPTGRDLHAIELSALAERCR